MAVSVSVIMFRESEHRLRPLPPCASSLFVALPITTHSKFNASRSAREEPETDFARGVTGAFVTHTWYGTPGSGALIYKAGCYVQSPLPLVTVAPSTLCPIRPKCGPTWTLWFGA